jgi:hypothetical protein
MILGLDWLTGLGPMRVDWGKGKLSFSNKGREVTLQVQDEITEVQLCEGRIILEKERKIGNEVIMAHVFSVSKEFERPDSVNPTLQRVLEEFSDIFEEPRVLPPMRSQDYSIPLLSNSKQVNLRPHSYSYFQKLEIEKIIEELLQKGFIQPSSGPFASPILLVKKKDNSWRC